MALSDNMQKVMVLLELQLIGIKVRHKCQTLWHLRKQHQKIVCLFKEVDRRLSLPYRVTVDMAPAAGGAVMGVLPGRRSCRWTARLFTLIRPGARTMLRRENRITAIQIFTE